MPRLTNGFRQPHKATQHVDKKNRQQGNRRQFKVRHGIPPYLLNAIVTTQPSYYGDEDNELIGSQAIDLLIGRIALKKKVRHV